MAFLLKTRAESQFKVALGSSQTCSCSRFKSSSKSCVHIFWVMLKMFHVAPDNELIWQNSLIDREIDELMACRKRAVITF